MILCDLQMFSPSRSIPAIHLHHVQEGNGREGLGRCDGLLRIQPAVGSKRQSRTAGHLGMRTIPKVEGKHKKGLKLVKETENQWHSKVQNGQSVLARSPASSKCFISVCLSTTFFYT